MVERGNRPGSKKFDGGVTFKTRFASYNYHRRLDYDETNCLLRFPAGLLTAFYPLGRFAPGKTVERALVLRAYDRIVIGLESCRE